MLGASVDESKIVENCMAVQGESKILLSDREQTCNFVKFSQKNQHEIEKIGP